MANICHFTFCFGNKQHILPLSDQTRRTSFCFRAAIHKLKKHMLCCFFPAWQATTALPFLGDDQHAYGASFSVLQTTNSATQLTSFVLVANRKHLTLVFQLVHSTSTTHQSFGVASNKCLLLFRLESHTQSFCSGGIQPEPQHTSTLFEWSAANVLLFWGGKQVNATHTHTHTFRFCLRVVHSKSSVLLSKRLICFFWVDPLTQTPMPPPSRLLDPPMGNARL